MPPPYDVILHPTSGNPQKDQETGMHQGTIKDQNMQLAFPSSGPSLLPITTRLGPTRSKVSQVKHRPINTHKAFLLSRTRRKNKPFHVITNSQYNSILLVLHCYRDF